MYCVYEYIILNIIMNIMNIALHPICLLDKSRTIVVSSNNITSFNLVSTPF